jgi:hypothetical protein
MFYQWPKIPKNLIYYITIGHLVVVTFKHFKGVCAKKFGPREVV